MPRNKPTKEELLQLAELGGDDKELFLLDKITAFKDEIEEIDQTLEETDEEIKELEKSLKESGNTLDSKIEQTRQELDSKVQELSAVISKIDFTSSVKEIIQHVSDTGILKGQDGKTPTKKELTAIIKPLIPEPEKAKEVDEEALAMSILERIDLSPLETIDEKIDDRLKDLTFETKDIEGLEDFIKKNLPKREIGKRSIKFMNDFDGASNFTNGYKMTWNASKDKFDLQPSEAGSGDMEASVYDPAGGEEQVAFASELHDAVTLAGTGTYISLAGQVITVDPITESDISDLGTYQEVLAEGAFVDGDKTKLDGIETGADVTDATNVNAAGAVMESDFTPAFSIIAQQSGTGSPSMVQVGVDTIVGRLTGGDIDDLTPAQVRTLILTPATPTTYTPSGTTQTITFGLNDQLAILDLGSATGDVTLTLSGMVAGGAYTIKVIQGATARNLVFPASVIASSSQTAWDSGTSTLTMTATDDAVDVVGLSYDGTSTLMTAEFDLS